MMNSRLTELHAAIQPGESATATHWPVSSEARRSAGFRSAYVSSKTGKAQNEHMFSGVPPITDMRRCALPLSNLLPASPRQWHARTQAPKRFHCVPAATPTLSFALHNCAPPCLRNAAAVISIRHGIQPVNGKRDSHDNDPAGTSSRKRSKDQQG
jgi:hypothetical protein